MKEVKEYGKGYIFLSALYVALGVVLLIRPSLSVRTISNVFGIIMIVLGATYGILYFTRDRLEGFLQMDLVIGIVCLAFGVFIIVNPSFIAAVLPFAMGILLLLGAVMKLQSSVNMKRLRFSRWYIVLIFALVMIALGTILLFNPFQEERYLLIYIGICLILDGLTNLISMISILLRVKSLNRMQRDNPDTPWQDLLDQKLQNGRKGGGTPGAPGSVQDPGSAVVAASSDPWSDDTSQDP